MKSWRQRLLAAAFAWSLAGSVLGQATYDPEIQHAFVEGAKLLEAGDYEAAAQTFRALLQRTNSPRIKLELARTLFLLKQYRESRALFKEVQLDSDVPWQVRDNIDAFIQNIDNAIGYVKFSVSLVGDSNPRNITSQREFTIGGVRLTFQPPSDNEKVTGLRYSAQAFQPIHQDSRLGAYLVGSYLDYPTSALDRLTLDGGLVKELAGASGARARAGIEAGTFGDKRLYHFPYLGYLHPLSRSASHNVHGELKLGEVKFPHFRYLDATYASATLSAFKVASQAVALSLGGTLEDSRAREKPYSYYGVTLAPGIAWLVTEPALLLKLELGFGNRRYADIDPFFGEERRDRRTRLDFSVRSKQWRWMNFTPAVVLSIDRTRSNIAFYSYEKVNVSLAME
jgi:tetratricopeptide (TPR) repeat protein